VATTAGGGGEKRGEMGWKAGVITIGKIFFRKYDMLGSRRRGVKTSGGGGGSAVRPMVLPIEKKRVCEDAPFAKLKGGGGSTLRTGINTTCPVKGAMTYQIKGPCRRRPSCRSTLRRGPLGYGPNETGKRET